MEDLSPSDQAILLKARLALAEVIEMFERHSNIRAEKIVFLINDGWEAELSNVAAMERYYKHENDHGLDEKRNANGE